jgi:bifunctional non-homologous end joining protein LigD
VLAKAGPGIRFNEHIEGDGPSVFAHACKMGLEGIVSKRKDSAFAAADRPIGSR